MSTERAGRFSGLAHVQYGGGVAHISHNRQATKIGYGFAQQREFLPPVSDIWFDRPVTLPRGRARLATRPVPTGSDAAANTIGMSAVACFAARVGGVPTVTMTSTLSRTNSAAFSA